MQIYNNPKTESAGQAQGGQATSTQENSGGSGGGLIGGIIGGVTGIIGMMGNRRRETRARKNQEILMAQQMKNQQQLNEEGHQQQKDMWDYTNYGNQMKHLKDAGLNAGLLYGQSGGGGTTAGGQVGGTAAGGSAPSPAYASMDMAAQMAMASQIALTVAQTKKTEAEAEKIAGADTDNVKANTNLTNINAGIQEMRKMYSEREISAQVNMLEQELDMKQRQNLIDERTMYEQIDKVKAEAVGQQITNDLNAARIRLTEEQEEQVRQAVMQKWKEIDLHDTEVNIKIAQTIINGVGTIGGLMQAGRLAESMKNAKRTISKKTEKTMGSDGRDVWKETTYE